METPDGRDAPTAPPTLLPVHERVALIADVHGNAPALTAVLDEARADGVDALVFLGCLTWGPEPTRVIELAQSTGRPTYFLRGNGERAVLELAAGTRDAASPTDSWMVNAHGPAGVQFLAALPTGLIGQVAGIGRIRLCHGSPRSDIELLTPGTPPERIAAACADVTESTIAHGHTHLQYTRLAGQRRVIGVGSVGLPYGGDEPGARWTVVGPTIEPRRTAYDIDEAIAAADAVNYPGLERYTGTLRQPPTLQMIIDDAESKGYSD